jgi:hypothetical protein
MVRLEKAHEARRIASNIAKLPVLLGQRHEDEDTTPKDTP